jgi:hypothetical protein
VTNPVRGNTLSRRFMQEAAIANDVINDWVPLGERFAHSDDETPDSMNEMSGRRSTKGMIQVQDDDTTDKTKGWEEKAKNS